MFIVSSGHVIPYCVGEVFVGVDGAVFTLVIFVGYVEGIDVEGESFTNLHSTCITGISH